MKFYEYKAHEIFRKYGIRVPRGVLATRPEEIVDPPFPCVVKAQVLVGGRGKAGGIKFARTLEEARENARSILGMSIGPYTVRQVYLQEMLDIDQELYLSITIDRSARAPLLMASVQGGVDIESVPENRIFRMHIPPLVGVQPYLLRALAKALALPEEIATQVSDIAGKAYALFRGEDAELVEINPLAVLKDGRVMAGDAKLIIDDNAEYRHPEYADLPQDRTPLEEDPEKVNQAFEILLKANPSVILLNIFGGITKADTVALGVKEALEEMHVNVPVVARIKGVNEGRAREILAGIGHPADTVEEAAEIAVKASTGGA
ncbi:MAG: ADP-forming succinate--CoA ligase subunit beta [Methanobacteriota archaeon]|nr:MAG: ADP-forming succinate--CoA ligase subunit beta [Euryarchaeota archaeon]